MLEVHLVPILTDNYVYVLKEKESAEVLVIDPGRSEPVIEFLKNKNWICTEIWITHHHWDHVDGVDDLRNATGAHITGNIRDKHRLPKLDRTVSEGQMIEFGSSRAKVLSIPGHTLGHIAYHFEGEKILLSGDTLFSCGCGRLFEGTPEMMFNTFKLFHSLPKDTQICCTHEYTLTNIAFTESIGRSNSDVEEWKIEVQKKRNRNEPSVPLLLERELKVNPFLRAKTSAEFAEIRSARDQF